MNTFLKIVGKSLKIIFTILFNGFFISLLIFCIIGMVLFRDMNMILTALFFILLISLFMWYTNWAVWTKGITKKILMILALGIFLFISMLLSM